MGPDSGRLARSRHGCQLQTRPVRLGQAGLGLAWPEKNAGSSGLASAARSQPGRALTRRNERFPQRHALKLGSGSRPRALHSEYARAKAFGISPHHPARAMCSRSRRADCGQPRSSPAPLTPLVRAGSVLAPSRRCPHGTGSAEALTTGCSSPGTWLRWGSCGRRGHSLDGRKESRPVSAWLHQGSHQHPQGVNTKGKINVVLKARQVPGCNSAPPDLRWGPTRVPRHKVGAGLARRREG